MRSVLFLLFLGMAHFCHAQKLRRHEITVGYYGGYFFDETPFRLQSIKLNRKVPPLSYVFRWNRKFDTGLLYGIQNFGYLNNETDGIPPPNTIYGRIIRHYSINAGYRFKFSDFYIRQSIGLSYRTGFKAKHLYTYDYGTWIEGYDEYYNYNDIGVLVGVSIIHPILKRLFGALSINYTRYFSDFDRNLFMPGYKIGFRF
jgi:hypothetical protein